MWLYREQIGSISRPSMALAMEATSCIFCKGNLHTLNPDYVGESGLTATLNGKPAGLDLIDELAVDVCPKCGWWRIDHVHDDFSEHFRWWGTYGIIRALAGCDVSIPTERLKNQIQGAPDIDFASNQSRLDELVRSVFIEYGYETPVTGYIEEGGIAVIMRGAEGTIGLHLELTNREVTISRIKELAGVLLVNGVARGLIIITSANTSVEGAVLDPLGRTSLAAQFTNLDQLFAAMSIERVDAYDLQDSSCPLRDVVLDYYSAGHVEDLALHYRRREGLPVLPRDGAH